MELEVVRVLFVPGPRGDLASMERDVLFYGFTKASAHPTYPIKSGMLRQPIVVVHALGGIERFVALPVLLV